MRCVERLMAVNGTRGWGALLRLPGTRAVFATGTLEAAASRRAPEPMTGRLRPLAWRLAILPVSTALVTGAPVATDAVANQKRVLVIHQLRRESAASAQMNAVLQEQLTASFPGGVDLHVEDLDLFRFPDAAANPKVRDYLQSRYDAHTLDVVIATSTAALRAVRGGTHDLFPGVPVVFHAGATVTAPRATGVRSTIDFRSSVETALAVHPAARRLVVVNGASAFDQGYAAAIRDQLRPLESRLSVEYLFGLPIAALESAVADLPPDALVYFVTLSQDGAGRTLLPIEAFERLAARARVPMYAFTDDMLGRGALGGRTFSAAVLAYELATLAARVMKGERPESITPYQVNPYVMRWDGRQLRRFGVDEGRLPPGSAVLFRYPLWDRYWPYLIAAGALIAAQGATIAALLVQRARRREAELRARREAAHVQKLAGGLISAQEAERSRIARDLHDDACQEVASIAVDVSQMRQAGAALATAEGLARLRGIEARAASVAEMLRRLSHDLHPTTLTHVGLVGALEAHCADFERLHGVRVTLRVAARVAPGREAALALFRIAQEALRNAARHGRAANAHVVLDHLGGRLVLSVEDDGAGFDVRAAADSGGLGLISISERARLIGGGTLVSSRPGHGAYVEAWVPCHQHTNLECEP